MAKIIKANFKGASGASLSAVIELPNKAQPIGFALFAHCFTCTKDIFAARQITKTLARHGIAVMRFDFTGLGESEGEFASTNFTSNVEDLVTAAHYLKDNFQAPKLMIGHSLGGAATLAAAGEVDDCQAVCTIGAPADPAHLEHLFTAHSEEIRDQGEAEVLLAGRPFVIQRQFLDDISKFPIDERVKTLKKALLICHAPYDETVSVDNAKRIYTAAMHPKSFLSLDGADHLLTKRQDAEYCAEVIATWSSRYFAKANVKDETKKLDANMAIVKEAGGTGLAKLISVGSHELISDEPLKEGGGNAGPTPYDLLIASIGSSIATTIRTWASKNEIKLEQIFVDISHEKSHIQDLTQSTTISIVECSIHAAEKLADKEQQQILQVAQTSPVFIALSKSININITINN